MADFTPSHTPLYEANRTLVPPIRGLSEHTKALKIGKIGCLRHAMLIENEEPRTAPEPTSSVGAPSRAPLHKASHPTAHRRPTIGDMDEYLQISSSEIFFVADSHFRDRRLPGEAERRDRFIQFLLGVPKGAALFLLGDIFDFYFEYATVVPKRYFDIFYALNSCRSRGVEVHFLGGNHDYWFGDFIGRDLGMYVHNDDFLIEGQGRKIRCTHGDLLVPDDRGYRTLRSILRNPFLIKTATLLHPDLLSGIARRVSGGTNKKRKAQKETANRLANAAGDNCYRWGNDAFVMGHIHYPLHRVHDGRDFVIVGDWIDNFSFAKLADGKISLEIFKS